MPAKSKLVKGDKNGDLEFTGNLQRIPSKGPKANRESWGEFYCHRCKNTKLIRTCQYYKYSPKDCGCGVVERSKEYHESNREDIRGKTFGRLIVLKDSPFKFTEGKNGRHLLVECFCECCKNNKYIHAAELKKKRRGKARATCGCVEGRSINKTGKYFCGGFITQISHDAKSRDLMFDIDAAYLDSLYEKQNGRDYYTGEKLEPALNTKRRVISLDRIDNSKGYEKDNIVLTTWGPNRARGNNTQEDFLNQNRRIAAVHPAPLIDEYYII